MKNRDFKIIGRVNGEVVGIITLNEVNKKRDDSLRLKSKLKPQSRRKPVEGNSTPIIFTVISSINAVITAKIPEPIKVTPDIILKIPKVSIDVKSENIYKSLISEVQYTPSKTILVPASKNTKNTVYFNGLRLADIGYYLNVATSTKRRVYMETHLRECNITGVQRENCEPYTSSGLKNLMLTTTLLYKRFKENKDAETLLILEDDVKFLPIFKEKYQEIITDIYSKKWDIFWLGCVNNRKPKPVGNNCYQVAYPSYAQSYLVSKNFVTRLLELYKGELPSNSVADYIDGFLALVPYGTDVLLNPNKYNFYNLENPLEKLPTVFTALCHFYPLSTQCNGMSSISHNYCNLEDVLDKYHPATNPALR